MQTHVLNSEHRRERKCGAKRSNRQHGLAWEALSTMISAKYMWTIRIVCEFGWCQTITIAVAY